MDKILGVKIDNLTKVEIRQKMESFLTEDRFHQIATINPEFILETRKNPEFKNILNTCDLNVADGFGIKLAFRRYGKILRYRIAGIDLMLEILKIANDKKLSVFLAANKNGLSSWEKTRDAILKIYPGLKIYGSNINCHSDPPDGGEESNLDIKSRSLHGVYTRATSGRDDKIDCDIVFCNFGAPYQEIFLKSLKNNLPLRHIEEKPDLSLENGNLSKKHDLQHQGRGGRIRLTMGVGGSFDYLTGRIPRAPQFLRQIGLEWLWRLILQPQRWRRILNAVIIFPLKVISNKE
jgi:N-acetylglucosaminyldiphosphoundecaprenol N-acetyl-beta-D-mannosaminyltransferase